MLRRHDRDRFQTALFAPAAHREALFALYAFNYEIARVREAVTQPVLGQIRLEWWRENIAAAYQNGAIRRHPIVEKLTAAIRERELTRAYFERLIEAREVADFADEPPASLAALEDYAEATSSTVIALALEVLGVREAAAAEAGRHVGIAYALCGLLRALPYLMAVGRPIVPVDIAARCSLDPRDCPAARSSRGLRVAVAEIAAAASGRLRAARGHRRVASAALPALLPAVIAAHSLRRLKRAGYDPFDPALVRPDPLQSWRLAAATVRLRLRRRGL